MRHDMDLPVHGCQSDRRMSMVWSHDLDCIDSFFFCKQLPEILVGSAALVFARWFILAVISFGVSLTDIPAAGDSGFAFPPGRLTQCFPDAIPDSVWGPVDVVRRRLIRVADSHHPHLGMLQQRTHLS